MDAGADARTAADRSPAERWLSSASGSSGSPRSAVHRSPNHCSIRCVHVPIGASPHQLPRRLAVLLADRILAGGHAEGERALRRTGRAVERADDGRRSQAARRSGSRRYESASDQRGESLELGRSTVGSSRSRARCLRQSPGQRRASASGGASQYPSIGPVAHISLYGGRGLFVAPPTLNQPSMPAMTHSTNRPAIRALHLLLPLALLVAAGCSVSDADERSHAGQTQVDEGDLGRARGRRRSSPR